MPTTIPREIQCEITGWLTTSRDLENASQAGLHIDNNWYNHICRREHQARYSNCLETLHKLGRETILASELAPYQYVVSIIYIEVDCYKFSLGRYIVNNDMPELHGELYGDGYGYYCTYPGVYAPQSDLIKWYAHNARFINTAEPTPDIRSIM